MQDSYYKYKEQERENTVAWLLNSDMDPNTKNWVTEQFTRTSARRKSIGTTNAMLLNEFNININDNTNNQSIIDEPSSTLDLLKDELLEAGDTSIINITNDDDRISSMVNTTTTNSPSLLLNPLPLKDIALLDSWTFPIFDYNDDQLTTFIFNFETKTSLLSSLSIDLNEFHSLLLTIRSNYRNIPYHNFWHAVDVCQTCYCFYININ